jgi:hypothetical protein
MVFKAGAFCGEGAKTVVKIYKKRGVILSLYTKLPKNPRETQVC